MNSQLSTLNSQLRYKLPMGVLDVATSGRSKTLFVACMDGVYQLSLDGGDYRRLFRHSSYSSSVVSLPDDPVLIAAGLDGSVLWFDLESETIFRRVLAHDFWSWQMALSPDARRVATVTGQYLAGGIKYEPAAETEPSVKVFDTRTGDLRHQFSHVPPVQSVAFSPDSRYVAAGNLMGQVRIWDLNNNQLVAQWTTDAFTSWGIIKSHCYIGGIYALQFTTDGQHVLLAGMGPMRDPMAGNGRQLWQRFAWRETPPRLIDQTHEGESGEGLMETLAMHPSGKFFLMGGRLRGGKWNAALFSTITGDRLHAINTGYRMTSSATSGDGRQLITGGCFKQPHPKDADQKPFGAVDVHDIRWSDS